MDASSRPSCPTHFCTSSPHTPPPFLALLHSARATNIPTPRHGQAPTLTLTLTLRPSLRLFLSPYFSISVAMHYLKTYPDSIGISHYLCWRMKAMPAEEVEFYWPQIWYVCICVCVCACISAVRCLHIRRSVITPATL